MNNYVSMEKSLKRWLKNRVKVTTATVVGFLIMGTVTFASTVIESVNNDKITISEGKITDLKQDYFTNINNEIVKDGGGKPVLINISNYPNEQATSGEVNFDGKLNYTGNKEIDYLVSINGEKDKDITINLSENTELKGNLNSKKATLNLYGETNTINNGVILKTSKNYFSAITINTGSNNASSTFTNGIKGMIKSEGKGTGVELSTNDLGNIKFINNGQIIGVEITEDNKWGKNGAGASLNGNVAFTNEKTGFIRGIQYGLYADAMIKDNIIITNNGEIRASDDGIYFDGYTGSADTKIQIANNGRIVINDVKVSPTGNQNGEAIGIYVGNRATAEQAIITNNGQIDIKSDAETNSISLVTGIRVHENVKAENTEKGIITVEGNKSSGVAVTGGAEYDSELRENYTSFTNNGNINVTGSESIGILVRHDAYNLNGGNATPDQMLNASKNLNISAINGEKGKIIVTGDNTVGVLLTTRVADKVVIPENIEYNLSFINNGTIELKDVKNGTGILVEAGTALNKGTIALGMNETGNVAINNVSGVAKNTGIIKVTDMTKDEITTEVNKDEALKYLFKGEVEHLGLIVDKNDNALFLDENTTVKGDTTTDILDGLAQGNGSVGVDGNLTITGTGDNTVESETFNVTGGIATIKGEVIINSDKINLDKDGKLMIDKDSTLALENGNLEKIGEGVAINIVENGTLTLDNMNVNGDIAGIGTVNITGNGELNGSITGTPDNKITINFGTVTKTFALRNTEVGKALQELSADGGLSNAVVNIGSDIQLGLEVKEDGTNKFGNSTGMELTGTGNEDVIIRTGNLTGNEITINLGENKYTNVDMITDSEIYIAGDVIDNAAGKDEIIIKYNDELYKGNDELTTLHKAASVLNGGTFSGNKAERAAQLDKIYSENIYSETVRAAYDSLKMSEEAVLSLAHEVKAGEFKADGKALYSKDEYTKDGSIGSYDAEVESTGLLASLEYGLSDTATAGVVFSGVKQDVDTDGGSADADLFYLGVFGTKAVGNYDFTAGLGYQFGEYEADNNIANIAGSDKYDSTAFSGYVQGRYTADLGDGLSVQPKVKLGYTYLEQDDAKDSYFGVSDAEVSTFDAELGLDVVKSVQFEKSRLDVKFGASYVRTMGDTDEMFKGHFYGNGTSSFDVIGAELAENVVKFNLGAESVQENGFFYNGGFTYEFGSNDTEAYGVNLGVGYKF